MHYRVHLVHINGLRLYFVARVLNQDEFSPSVTLIHIIHTKSLEAQVNIKIILVKIIVKKKKNKNPITSMMLCFHKMKIASLSLFFKNLSPQPFAQFLFEV